MVCFGPVYRIESLHGAQLANSLFCASEDYSAKSCGLAGTSKNSKTRSVIANEVKQSRVFEKKSREIATSLRSSQ